MFRKPELRNIAPNRDSWQPQLPRAPSVVGPFAWRPGLATLGSLGVRIEGTLGDKGLGSRV